MGHDEPMTMPPSLTGESRREQVRPCESAATARARHTSPSRLPATRTAGEGAPRGATRAVPAPGTLARSRAAPLPEQIDAGTGQGVVHGWDLGRSMVWGRDPFRSVWTSRHDAGIGKRNAASQRVRSLRTRSGNHCPSLPIHAVSLRVLAVAFAWR